MCIAPWTCRNFGNMCIDANISANPPTRLVPLVDFVRECRILVPCSSLKNLISTSYMVVMGTENRPAWRVQKEIRVHQTAQVEVFLGIHKCRLFGGGKPYFTIRVDTYVHVCIYLYRHNDNYNILYIYTISHLYFTEVPWNLRPQNLIHRSFGTFLPSSRLQMQKRQWSSKS